MPSRSSNPPSFSEMPQNTFYRDFDTATMRPRKLREGEYRSAFAIDRDRIIHTSAFRRLQSKTQVFLSGEYDFYRTRLTHSIEVSQIGRGICSALLMRSTDLRDDFFIDADLVEAICLSHDLGHPPFGHAGERTLHELMRPYGGFEGNAQTLRLLTETIFSGQQSGMDPCRALIDGVLKYKTLLAETPQAHHHFIYTSQAQFLDFAMGGVDFPVEYTPGKARNAFRSIECQIMDWSDDTAYSLNDIADALNAGFLHIETVERWAEQQTLTPEAAEQVQKLLRVLRKGPERVENMLRAKIGQFIDAVTLVPDRNHMSELTNRYAFRLEIAPEAVAESKLYKRLALDLVFRSRQLEQLELKADRLLTQLFQALERRYIQQAGPQLHLLSALDESAIEAATDEAGKARVICDCLSHLTDNQATRFYRRLFEPDYGSMVDLV
jgi:dGTPase